MNSPAHIISRHRTTNESYKQWFRMGLISEKDFLDSALTVLNDCIQDLIESGLDVEAAIAIAGDELTDNNKEMLF